MARSLAGVAAVLLICFAISAGNYPLTDPDGSTCGTAWSPAVETRAHDYHCSEQLAQASTLAAALFAGAVVAVLAALGLSVTKQYRRSQ